MKTGEKIAAVIIALLMIPNIMLLSYYLSFNKSYTGIEDFDADSGDSQILIAYKSSEYKEELLSKLVDRMNRDGLKCNITTIERLEKSHLLEYRKIVILLPVINGNIPDRIERLLNDENAANTVFLALTSGSTDWNKYENIDTITSASDFHNIIRVVEKIMKNINSKG